MRARYLVPHIRRVGGNMPLLEEAARAEGFVMDSENPELWVSWSPDQEFCHDAPALPSLCAVSVVATSVASPPLPVMGFCHPARRSATLREWVAQWPLGGILRPFLASEAVGSRACTIRIPQASEWLFLKTPGAKQSVESGGLREMAVTLFGLGRFPIMPATLASAVMLVLALWLRARVGGAGFWEITLAVAGLATISAVALESWAERRFLTSDPREFVLDEVAGLALTWAMLPPSSGWEIIVLGFLLFRIFDIFKWGIHWVERLRLPGVIVWDDLLAGAYAGFATLAIRTFLSS